MERILVSDQSASLMNIVGALEPIEGSALNLNGLGFQFLSFRGKTVTPTREAAMHEAFFFQGYYFFSGSAQIRVAAKEERTSQRLQAGQLCLLAPGTAHEVRGLEESQVFSFRFQMQESSGPSHEPDGMPRPAGHLLKIICRDGWLRVDDGQGHFWQSLHAFSAAKQDVSLLSLQLQFLQAILAIEASLIQAEKASQKEAKKRQSPNELVQRLVAYIDQHYAKPLSCEQIAAAAHRSYGHAARVFKQVTGMTVVEYLSMTRLKQAQKELRDTHDSVKAIAGRCGFQHVNYFSSLFKKRYGLSPLAYRRAHQK